jgi:hypothetical protein
VANYKLSRADLFPATTSVAAFLTGPRGAAAMLNGSKPAGTAVETKEVDGESNAIFTSLVEGKFYVLYAEVAGEKRMLMVEGPEISPYLGLRTTEGMTRTPPARTLRERINVRRQLFGAWAPGTPGPAGAI